MSEMAPESGGGDFTPRHVAIIMDGNGRWATARGLPRAAGHRAGVEAARRAVETAGDLGLSYLTLYSFSTENWRRPAGEVRDLMTLLRKFIAEDLPRLKKEGVRVRIIGDRESLDRELRSLVARAEKETSGNQRFTLQIAFNYGGRDELLRAARSFAHAVHDGAINPKVLDEGAFERHLDTAGAPDPELIIRTSGEKRISNFLLWQAAYAEYVFLDVLWPDFDRAHFEQAIKEYRLRERRFGGVGEGAD
ncbi:MAG: isoprenyl transferase [Parvularculaceae bacterium]